MSSFEFYQPHLKVLFQHFEWLEVDFNNSGVNCRLCRKTILINQTGLDSVIIHMSGKRHRKLKYTLGVTDREVRVFTNGILNGRAVTFS